MLEIWCKRTVADMPAHVVACLNYILHRMFTVDIPKYLKFAKYFEVYYTQLIIKCCAFLIPKIELILGFLFVSSPPLIPNEILCDVACHVRVILLNYHKG
jgi:hypothetical protein